MGCQWSTVSGSKSKNLIAAHSIFSHFRRIEAYAGPVKIHFKLTFTSLMFSLFFQWTSRYRHNWSKCVTRSVDTSFVQIAVVHYCGREVHARNRCFPFYCWIDAGGYFWAFVKSTQRCTSETLLVTYYSSFDVHHKREIYERELRKYHIRRRVHIVVADILVWVTVQFRTFARINRCKCHMPLSAIHRSVFTMPLHEFAIFRIAEQYCPINKNNVTSFVCRNIKWNKHKVPFGALIYRFSLAFAQNKQSKIKPIDMSVLLCNNYIRNYPLYLNSNRINILIRGQYANITPMKLDWSKNSLETAIFIGERLVSVGCDDGFSVLWCVDRSKQVSLRQKIARVSSGKPNS